MKRFIRRARLRLARRLYPTIDARTFYLDVVLNKQRTRRFTFEVNEHGIVADWEKQGRMSSFGEGSVFAVNYNVDISFGEAV